MKYIFKQIDDISGSNAVMTIEFNADTIYDVLEQFQFFLRGSGFHFDGNLDFVNHEDVEEPDEWTQTLRDDSEWLFPKERPVENNTEPWEGIAPSVAMQWTVNQLMKEKSVCPVCKIDNETMINHECWDKNCPKGNDAN